MCIYSTRTRVISICTYIIISNDNSSVHLRCACVYTLLRMLFFSSATSFFLHFCFCSLSVFLCVIVVARAVDVSVVVALV